MEPQGSRAGQAHRSWTPPPQGQSERAHTENEPGRAYQAYETEVLIARESTAVIVDLRLSEKKAISNQKLLLEMLGTAEYIRRRRK